jgi:hypothetical protein
VFIEHLWCTLKHDHIYLNPQSIAYPVASVSLGTLDHFDEVRPRSSTNNHTPDEVYCQSRINQPVA